LTAARASGPRGEVGCVLDCEVGVLVVLTDDGPVRATYAGRLLCAVARDRTGAPEPGDWVELRRWQDGPVTVEVVLTRHRSQPLAQVLPLRPRRR
jgi:ribosome biogenesis GTPase